jgi:hypothetical protein
MSGWNDVCEYMSIKFKKVWRRNLIISASKLRKTETTTFLWEIRILKYKLN